MPQITTRNWSVWLLFWSCLTVALILIALVLLAPLFDHGKLDTHGWRRLLVLFARDVAVRRTAVGSAIGLAVTACVFFRVPYTRPRGPSGPRTPAPVNVVGA